MTALSRDAERASASLGVPALSSGARPTREPPPAEALRGRDAVVHLLGETIAQRWSDDVKREIRDSRVLATAQPGRGAARAARGRAPARAGVPVGRGFYGARGDERLDESAPAGDDFLAHAGRRLGGRGAAPPPSWACAWR